MTRALALACLCAALCACSEPTAPVPGPGAAQRVVTFSPHLAEIMFAVGAGDQLVGVSAWSDYPRAVLELPEVGDAFTIDQEALSLLQPDLLLVWESGMPAHTVDDLRQRGYRVEAIRSRSLEEVAAAVRRVGELTGQQASAAKVAADFVGELAALRAANVDADPIDVFFQISARPLYTINREHFMSELIAACGGRNIFDDLEVSRARRCRSSPSSIAIRKSCWRRPMPATRRSRNGLAGPAWLQTVTATISCCPRRSGAARPAWRWRPALPVQRSSKRTRQPRSAATGVISWRAAADGAA